MRNVIEVITLMAEEMSREQIRWAVVYTSFFLCMMVGLLLYRFYQKGKRLQEEGVGQRIYESMEDTFREGRSREYLKLQLWLKSIGADYTIKGLGDPFRFVIANLLIMIGCVLVVGIYESLWIGLVVAVFMVMLEILWLLLEDHKSNQEMLEDISFLYDATAIQLNSNIYVIKAVMNCLMYIRSKRLRDALSNLCSNVTLGGDVRTAAKDFCEKFRNEYLDTFCNVIIQITAETGESGKLIEDMSKQLSVLKETNFAGRKKSTENKLQLCIIGIFLVFTALIFFLCIASMSGSTAMLF